jgi:nitric-oxide synthase
MPVPGYRNVPVARWSRDEATDLVEAEEFLRRMYAEHRGLGPVGPRLAEVRAQVAATGTYLHTSAELAYGAKLAWRNSSRCIGRLYWRSLTVRDRRHVSQADDIFTELVGHLHLAGNRDRRGIRPVITVFPPAAPGQPFPRVWNEQLIRYAGYRRTDGGMIGDPAYAGFTAAMTARGWRGKGEAFDVLPVVVETPAEGPRLYDLPESAVWEVPLVHPELPWFGELDMRWHAVPTISNMRLSIGGVNYPLAPFNGWYLGTEIGARNLADPDRYNLLPLLAHRMGLNLTSERTLWRDRALVELNRAVLYSFDRAGARISDHHTESRRFLEHVAREERNGRPVPADWTWIVPPMSSGTTAVFHRYYDELDLRPNFYLDDDSRLLGRDGHLAEPDGHAADHPTAPTQRTAPHVMHPQHRDHLASAVCPKSAADARVPTQRLLLRPACPADRAAAEHG